MGLILSCTGWMTPSVSAASYTEEIEDGWLFYHEQFVMHALDSSQAAQKVRLPIEFEEMDLDTETYGTFVTTVSVPEEIIDKQMGIELPFVYSAATIFINGEKIKDVGKTGENADKHETNLQTVLVPFTTSTPTIEIAIQLSSFNHIRGGFSAAPTIGEWESIKEDFLFERFTTIFIGTIILIVGLTTSLIGLMNRHEKLFLTFGLFSVTVAIRELFAVPFLYHELPFSISYITATRMEYVTTTISFSLFVIFISQLYKKIFSKWILYFIIGILSFLTILTIFTEPSFFQNAFFSALPLLIFFVAYNIYIMFKAIRLDLELAKSILVGVFFVLTGVMVDFLSGMGVITFPPIVKFMIVINVLTVLLSLCINYVNQVNKLREMNKDLDELVKERTSQLRDANKELKRLVITDALTGVYNRHKFNETLSENFNASVEKDENLGLIMLDIDEFKKYNDYYGHLHGDNILTQVAQSIQRILPNDVTFARFGGEEFAVVLQGYSIEETEILAEKIRETIEHSEIGHVDREDHIVTVSLGCAERKIDQVANDKQLIKISDERLYKSKAGGRNLVTAH